MTDSLVVECLNCLDHYRIGTDYQAIPECGTCGAVAWRVIERLETVEDK